MKWITRNWEEINDHEELHSIFEVEMFINDFSLWTVYKEIDWVREENSEVIYTLWYLGILQYVGITHRFEIRMQEHKASDRKFDEVKYFKVPYPWPVENFNTEVEKEIMESYRLNSNEFGERTYFEQPVFIRTKNDKFDNITKQITFNI